MPLRVWTDYVLLTAGVLSPLPGTSALPGIKNDFVNGEEVKVFAHDNRHIVLSMTSIALANPAGAVDTIRLDDREFRHVQVGWRTEHDQTGAAEESPRTGNARGHR